VSGTLIGVAARELARDGAPGSPYKSSKKPDADKTCASEGSDADTEWCRERSMEGSRMLFEMDRNRRSRDNCVRPRRLLEPSMV
jgi:hypothetical protein